MSHTVKVNLIADQEIEVDGQEVNIHDIRTITVDTDGRIIDVVLESGLITWKHCGCYLDWYGTKHTWFEIGPCSDDQKEYIKTKGINCDGCPFLGSVKSDDLEEVD